ncbi:hypothetical protein Aple_091910 [Acrocarpospora pleiomorpha]|uniref:Pyrrolo-quinoline quinone repeat domain-containing protein n=1 Tax=Acrocarpospora pleiomorpha TaxID=90975 RepID=A0A5M3XZ20_9ACTN|nr:PQQ-binding-like beta-propeller repeat protein [Acrocarpospora pleiomorpha]GES26292.1 hypothetical protein Aple_091910 [Acrocarpospora pleiomorpha]
MTGAWGLAIDLGTCCVTAATRYDGEAAVLPLDPGRDDHSLPALVLVDGDELVVGREAVDQVTRFPERIIRSPRHLLWADTALYVEGRWIDPVDPVAALLRVVSAAARHRFPDHEPDSTFLTYPARWDEPAQRRLREAAHRAGLGEVVLLPEAIAAARWYATRKPSTKGAVVAVYDLGGGGFDTAALRRTETGFELAGAAGGLDEVGGEEFDRALLHVVKQYARLIDPGAAARIWDAADRSAVMTQYRWAVEAREAKKALSRRRPCLVGGEPPFSPGIQVTPDEFEEAIGLAVRRTVTELGRTIRAAGLVMDELDAVYLTGGSSAIPLVSQTIAGRLQDWVAVEIAPDPKHTVVLGALTDVPPPDDGARPARPWRQRVAGQPTAPALSGSSLFTGTDQGRLYAFDLATGARRWQTGGYVPITGAAATEELVVIGDTDGRVSAYCSATGVRHWWRQLDGPLSTGPRVHGEHVYVASEQSGLHCLALATGVTTWRCRAAQAKGSPPVAADGWVFVGGRKGMLFAVAGRQEEWRVRLSSAPVVGPIEVTGSMIFAATEDGQIHAVPRHGPPEVRWRQPAGVSPGTGPRYHRGRVYAATGDGRIAVFDAEDGRPEPMLRAGAPVTALVPHGDALYVAAGSALSVARVADGTVRRVHGIDWPVEAAPAFADDFVFLCGTGGQVAAVRLESARSGDYGR